jgi:Domain of unknown function (DUF1707)
MRPGGSPPSYSVCMSGEVQPGRRDEVAPPDDLRASHEDRDRVAELLRVAAGDGRLTVEELDQRLEQALTARTYGELAGLTRDLPVAPGLAAAAPAQRPKDVVRIDCGSGSAKRDDRWLVPQRIEVRVASGRVTLDFTQAVIAHPSLQIDAEVRSGGLTLVTKPGVVVDTDDVAVRSGSVKVRAPGDPAVPVLLKNLCVRQGWQRPHHGTPAAPHLLAVAAAASLDLPAGPPLTSQSRLPELGVAQVKVVLPVRAVRG